MGNGEGKDYAQKAIKETGTGVEQQMTSNIITAVLIDVCWQRAADEILGREKKQEVGYRAWVKIGENSIAMGMKALGIDRVDDLDTLAKVLLACYAGLLIPTKIIDKTDNKITFASQSCPFPAYGFDLLRVKKGDHVCELWKAMTDAWLEGMIKATGFTGVIRGKIETAICMGDEKCVFYLEKIGS